MARARKTAEDEGTVQTEQGEPTETIETGEATTDTAPQTTEQLTTTAVPADLPETLYKRTTKTNPRTADVQLAVSNPTKDDGSPQWFRLQEANDKTAKHTANLVRRAAKDLGVKVSVKMPKTDANAVYFSIQPNAQP